MDKQDCFAWFMRGFEATKQSSHVAFKEAMEEFEKQYTNDQGN